MIELDDVYKFRSYARKLYTQDVLLGDLTGNIGDLRTNNEKIERIDIDINNCYIGVYFSKDSTENDISKVSQEIEFYIRDFILTNANSISELNGRESDLFLDYIQSPLLYDKIQVGNLIKFIL